jgi:hypothetical protein
MRSQQAEFRPYTTLRPIGSNAVWAEGKAVARREGAGGSHCRRYSILRLRLSLDGEVNSPCDNLAARICKQILAEQSIHFQW